MNIDKIVTLVELSRMHPRTFPPNRVRYLCNNRKKNGFNACLSLIGNRLYVDLEKFEVWLKSKNLIQAEEQKMETELLINDECKEEECVIKKIIYPRRHYHPDELTSGTLKLDCSCNNSIGYVSPHLTFSTKDLLVEEVLRCKTCGNVSKTVYKNGDSYKRPDIYCNIITFKGE